MRSDHPVLGALVWGALGFFLAGLIIVAYLSLTTPDAKLDDHALDQRARTSEGK